MSFDIIIIIAAVAISIISAISKNSKKKQENKPVPSKNIDSDIDDPWETLKRHIMDEVPETDVAGKDILVPTEQSRNSRGEVIKPEVIVQEIRKNYDDEEYITQLQAERLAVLDRKNTVNKSRSKKANKKEEKVLSEKAETVVNDNAVDEFDIRAAILYSEILKPKFKE